MKIVENRKWLCSNYFRKTQIIKR